MTYEEMRNEERAKLLEIVAKFKADSDRLEGAVSEYFYVYSRDKRLAKHRDAVIDPLSDHLEELLKQSHEALDKLLAAVER